MPFHPDGMQIKITVRKSDEFGLFVKWSGEFPPALERSGPGAGSMRQTMVFWNPLSVVVKTRPYEKTGLLTFIAGILCG